MATFVSQIIKYLSNSNCNVIVPENTDKILDILNDWCIYDYDCYVTYRAENAIDNVHCLKNTALLAFTMSSSPSRHLYDTEELCAEWANFENILRLGFDSDASNALQNFLNDRWREKNVPNCEASIVAECAEYDLNAAELWCGKITDFFHCEFSLIELYLNHLQSVNRFANSNVVRDALEYFCVKLLSWVIEQHEHDRIENDLQLLFRAWQSTFYVHGTSDVRNQALEFTSMISTFKSGKKIDLHSHLPIRYKTKLSLNAANAYLEWIYNQNKTTPSDENDFLLDASSAGMLTDIARSVFHTGKDNGYLFLDLIFNVKARRSELDGTVKVWYKISGSDANNLLSEIKSSPLPKHLFKTQEHVDRWIDAKNDTNVFLSLCHRQTLPYTVKYLFCPMTTHAIIHYETEFLCTDQDDTCNVDLPSDDSFLQMLDLDRFYNASTETQNITVKRCTNIGKKKSAQHEVSTSEAIHDRFVDLLFRVAILDVKHSSKAMPPTTFVECASCIYDSETSYDTLERAERGLILENGLIDYLKGLRTNVKHQVNYIDPLRRLYDVHELYMREGLGAAFGTALCAVAFHFFDISVHKAMKSAVNAMHAAKNKNIEKMTALLCCEEKTENDCSPQTVVKNAIRLLERRYSVATTEHSLNILNALEHLKTVILPRVQYSSANLTASDVSYAVITMPQL